MQISDSVVVLDTARDRGRHAAEVQRNPRVISAYLGEEALRAGVPTPAGKTLRMLVVTSVVTYYGSVQALKGISLHVNRGEIAALIGSNGAGKTTLLHTIPSGLARHSSSGGGCASPRAP